MFYWNLRLVFRLFDLDLHKKSTDNITHNRTVLCTLDENFLIRSRLFYIDGGISGYVWVVFICIVWTTGTYWRNCPPQHRPLGGGGCSLDTCAIWNYELRNFEKRKNGVNVSSNQFNTESSIVFTVNLGYKGHGHNMNKWNIRYKWIWVASQDGPKCLSWDATQWCASRVCELCMCWAIGLGEWT